MTQRPTVVWQSHNLRKPIENNHPVFQYVVSRELAQLQKHIRWHAVHFLNRYEKGIMIQNPFSSLFSSLVDKKYVLFVFLCGESLICSVRFNPLDETTER